MSILDLVERRGDTHPTEAETLDNEDARPAKRSTANSATMSQTTLDMANNGSVEELERTVGKLAGLLTAIRWLNNEKMNNIDKRDVIRGALVSCAKDLADEISRRF